MSYVIYALFPEPGTAEIALQDLARSQLTAQDCQVFVHKKKLDHHLTQDIRASESDGRKGFGIGILVGVLGGALMGWLVSGPLHLFALPLSAAIGLGIFLGVICGALGGGIYGMGLVDGDLKKLSNRFRPGHTLITAEIQTPESRAIVDQIFRKYGAIEATH